MSLKYTNIFHLKALRNIPKFGIFGLKIYHLATLFPGSNVMISKIFFAESCDHGIALLTSLA
jgi:hypothetical protein